MNAEVFVDTNVLLYAVSSDLAEGAKARRAREILGREDFDVSAQVLQELFVNATQKIRTRLTDQEALEFIDIISLAPIVPIDLALVVEAAGYEARFRISYWDGAIVAAAHALGASVLYTEDLNDGQVYGDVRVENPFRSSGRAR